jgi:hypothetical protein
LIKTASIYFKGLGPTLPASLAAPATCSSLC